MKTLCTSAAWLSGLALVFLMTPACSSVAPASAPPHGLPLFATAGGELLSTAFFLDDEDEDEIIVLEDDEAEDESPGVLHHILLYIPNRIFDVFDIVRARVRLGPGLAIGVRATETVDVFLGSYVSIWVGLHGPRGEPSIPWPVGIESLTGAEISLAEATVGGDAAPFYGPVEFGASFQAFLAGVDVGVDPLEILDLVAGFLFIDLTGDDY
jgi:hypothetical protein